MSNSTNETTPVLGLTEDEAEQLRACGRMLRAVASRLTYHDWDTHDRYTCVRMGQVIATAENADDALFNLANTASTYLPTDGAILVANDWHGRRDA